MQMDGANLDVQIEAERASVARFDGGPIELQEHRTNRDREWTVFRRGHADRQERGCQDEHAGGRARQPGPNPHGAPSGQSHARRALRASGEFTAEAR
jgi:hypothetical protein